MMETSNLLVNVAKLSAWCDRIGVKDTVLPILQHGNSTVSYLKSSILLLLIHILIETDAVWRMELITIVVVTVRLS